MSEDDIIEIELRIKTIQQRLDLLKSIIIRIKNVKKQSEQLKDIKF